MATEPERDIEKTLKACAAKRREEAGAPLELHPVTRKMLQGEVARLYATPESHAGFWAGLAALLRPRSLFVGIFAALLVAVGLLIPALNRNQRQQMAATAKPIQQLTEGKHPGTKAETPVNSPAPVSPSLDGIATFSGVARDKESLRKDIGTVAPAPPSSSSTLREEPDRRRSALTSGAEKSQSAADVPSQSASGGLARTKAPAAEVVVAPSLAPEPAPVASAAASPPASLPAGRAGGPHSVGALGLSPDLTKSLSARPPVLKAESGARMELANANRSLAVPPPPVERETFALSDAIAPTGSTTQRFFRLPIATKSPNDSLKPANRKPVLLSFRLEQTGNQVRIIDADGSVYSGSVQTADAATGARFGGFAGASTLSGNKQKAADEFKISTAKKDSSAKVPAAQGYFFRVTGTNRSLKQSVVFTGTVTPGAKPGAVPNEDYKNGAALLRLSQSQIHGQALIGGTNMVEVNAAPAAR